MVIIPRATCAAAAAAAAVAAAAAAAGHVILGAHAQRPHTDASSLYVARRRGAGWRPNRIRGSTQWLRFSRTVLYTINWTRCVWFPSVAVDENVGWNVKPGRQVVLSVRRRQFPAKVTSLTGWSNHGVSVTSTGRLVRSSTIVVAGTFLNGCDTCVSFGDIFINRAAVKREEFTSGLRDRYLN